MLAGLLIEVVLFLRLCFEAANVSSFLSFFLVNIHGVNEHERLDKSILKMTWVGRLMTS